MQNIYLLVPWWAPLLLIPLFSVPAAAAPAGIQDEVVIKRLVQDTTWRIRPISGAGFHSYWSWGSDGTFCYRSQGMAAGEPCVDQGRWRIEAGRLCWKLNWYGKSTGLNEACVHLFAQDASQYEAVIAEGSKFTFASRLEFELVPR